MAVFDNEFLNNSAFHSVVEERIQNEIENYLSGNITSASREIFDYVCPLRKILFEWYPFSPDSRILEVGGNFGELTGFLCKKGKEVVSIELNEAKKRIIQKRCYGYKNLQVNSIPIKNITDLGKFDYIIIHSCFGFLKKFYATSNTYVDFLKMLFSNLNDSGVVLIATSNRIGVKYLSGAVEEHTKKLFTGINNYDGYDKVRTFTRNEWIRIIEKAQISRYKFYYPFPTYVFPTEIHTTQSLKYFCYGDDDFTTDFEMPELFNRKSLMETFRGEGFSEYFANSFLIELSNKKSCNVIYYKPDLETRNHSSGYLIYGHDMNEATIKHLKLSEECNAEKNYDENTYYFANTDTKICFGNIGVLPSSIRLKERLLAIMDYSIKEDSTECLCEELCIWWRRIALSIRQVQIGKVRPNIDNNITEDFHVSIDNIYILKHGEIVILFPPEIIDLLKYNKEYIIWKLIYDWYMSEILNYQSRKKHISIKSLYEACEINIKKICEYRKKRNSMQTWTDKKEIMAHTYAKYELGLMEATQILEQGTPIINEYHKPFASDVRQSILLSESELLKNIRK